MTFELTLRCNLSCQMCPLDLPRDARQVRSESHQGRRQHEELIDRGGQARHRRHRRDGRRRHDASPAARSSCARTRSRSSSTSRRRRSTSASTRTAGSSGPRRRAAWCRSEAARAVGLDRRPGRSRTTRSVAAGQLPPPARRHPQHPEREERARRQAPQDRHHGHVSALNQHRYSEVLDWLKDTGVDTVDFDYMFYTTPEHNLADRGADPAARHHKEGRRIGPPMYLRQVERPDALRGVAEGDRRRARSTDIPVGFGPPLKTPRADGASLPRRRVRLRREVLLSLEDASASARTATSTRARSTSPSATCATVERHGDLEQRRLSDLPARAEEAAPVPQVREVLRAQQRISGAIFRRSAEKRHGTSKSTIESRLIGAGRIAGVHLGFARGVQNCDPHRRGVRRGPRRAPRTFAGAQEGSRPLHRRRRDDAADRAEHRARRHAAGDPREAARTAALRAGGERRWSRSRWR